MSYVHFCLVTPSDYLSDECAGNVEHLNGDILFKCGKTQYPHSKNTRGRTDRADTETGGRESVTTSASRISVLPPFRYEKTLN